jgi:hypothetical protein
MASIKVESVSKRFAVERPDPVALFGTGPNTLTAEALLDPEPAIEESASLRRPKSTEPAPYGRRTAPRSASRLAFLRRLACLRC